MCRNGQVFVESPDDTLPALLLGFAEVGEQSERGRLAPPQLAPRNFEEPQTNEISGRRENCKEGDRQDSAQLHEIGMHIGELSLGADFDGVLSWGWIDNRPFLRCMSGYGLCLWRLGKMTEAAAIFERMLWPL